jgi:hypothetical protein
MMLVAVSVVQSLTVIGAAIYHPHASADRIFQLNKSAIDRQKPEAQIRD